MRTDGDNQDSEFIVWFWVVMVVWCTVYLEFWKRRRARLAMAWGVMDVEEAAEVKAWRPEVCVAT